MSSRKNTVVHPTQISHWKRQLLEEGTAVFSTTTARQEQEREELQAELYEQIGRLKMELEWLKKKAVHVGYREARHD